MALGRFRPAFYPRSATASLSELGVVGSGLFDPRACAGRGYSLADFKENRCDGRRALEDVKEELRRRKTERCAGRGSIGLSLKRAYYRIGTF